MRTIMPMLMTLVWLAAQPALADGPAPDAPPGNDLQDIMVGVAISGGGLRSAAFAYGVISKLNEEWVCRGKNATNANGQPQGKWIVVEDKETGKCLNQETAKNLLDEVKIVSGVSGGALPAAFLHWYGKDYFLQNFETNGLIKSKDLANALKGGFRKAAGVEAGDILLDLLPFVPGGVLTARSLSAQLDSRGMIDIGTISTFFKDKEIFKPDEKLKTPKNHLLIHTTDLTNSGIFTFYEHDGECLADKDVAIEDVLAASAAMPGLVGPLIVYPGNAMNLSPDCSKRYGNAVRNASPDTGIFLNDGGVYDNLAIDGLLRYLVEKKRVENGRQETNTSKEGALRIKTLLLAINGSPPAAFTTLDPQKDVPGIVNLVLRAFDLLASQKDATSRFLFEEAQRYGIHVVELNFGGLLPDSGRDDRAIQMLRTLGRISWFPNEQEVQTLITAGRLVAANRAERIGEALNALSARTYVGDCSGLSEEDREYCWPDRWGDHNPFHDGLDRVLQEVRRDRDDLRKRQGKFLDEGRSGAVATLIDAMAETGSGDQVYAVDYGLIDWKGGFNDYQDHNIQAAERGVKIARTFIIHEELRNEPTGTRLARLIDVIRTQVEAGIDVRIALKERLKNDPRTMARYHRGHRNGMALFKYAQQGEPIYKVLMEEATEYSGEPGHPGLYYALQTHAAVDPQSGAGRQAVGMGSTVSTKKQRQHVEDRAAFLEWINDKVSTDRPPADVVCPLLGTTDKEAILSALRAGRTPCEAAARAKTAAQKQGAP